MMKGSLLGLLAFSVAGSVIASQGADREVQDGTQMAELEAVLPSTSEIMLQMGERYKNLYWAAKRGRWEFAAYQAEEMEELVEKLAIVRPKRAQTGKAFLARVYPALPKAIETREWRRFEIAFGQMRAQCVHCHAQNGHAFIDLPIPQTASSPVLNLP